MLLYIFDRLQRLVEKASSLQHANNLAKYNKLLTTLSVKHLILTTLKLLLSKIRRKYLYEEF